MTMVRLRRFGHVAGMLNIRIPIFLCVGRVKLVHCFE